MTRLEWDTGGGGKHLMSSKNYLSQIFIQYLLNGDEEKMIFFKLTKKVLGLLEILVFKWWFSEPPKLHGFKIEMIE